ncbi:ImmA/IrrE family metallo-endopeptidase [Shewanella xiamenensis]|uniref:ImmA/IrrE family metallo-endopeptidase n=1 Tax=Shewanella xiamenensis TaxID=332186 RepID=UPI001C4F3C8F|nr:ImmA/IrrE family metallo-endopeptidase [Shewanella xiamenensis]MCT8873231.1 ImmA/IrrE family metallo-endopeptidase [Shewanella xiamenensis]UWH42614.1 ImmA/IrrE family metallo-endopeptidase [Shewanella xiamenensis]
MTIERELKPFGGISAESLLNFVYGSQLNRDILPIDPVYIASKLTGVIIDTNYNWDDLVKSGYIKVKRNDNNTVKNIIVWANPSEAEVRRRFTLAHELGHLVYDVIPNLNNHQCEEIIDIFNRDQNQSFIETRANYFAAELLMPLQLIRAEIQVLLEKYQVLNNGQKPNFSYALEYLARQFFVSTEAMNFRLKNLGYV